MSQSEQAAAGGTVEQVWGLVDRPVWVVTSAADSRRGGLLATWVLQTSLDPETPEVAIALAPNHFTTELVLAGGMFAIHLLGPGQLETAWNFCLDSGRDRDKFASVPHTTDVTGSPLLTDCLARLECRVTDRREAPDRTYFWADVIGGRRFGNASPLTEQQLIAAATDQQLSRLKANRLADIAFVRDLDGRRPTSPSGEPPNAG